MESLDESYVRLTAELLPSARRVADSLPYRIGITTRPHLGWDDYARLGPMRDLPAYAAEAASSAPDLRPWILAHRAAGFAGLVRDRIRDGQVCADSELRLMERELRAVWLRETGSACGDASRARRRIERSLRRHANAVRAERAAFSRGALTVAEYARITRGKTDFLAISSELMLEVVAPGRLRAFRTAFDALMLSLQLFDDAIDAAEDRDVRGASVAELLGYHDGALAAASARIAYSAATRAGDSGFRSLSKFFAERTQARVVRSDPFLDAMGASLVVDELGAGSDPVSATASA